jgi:hypothetical protein
LEGTGVARSTDAARKKMVWRISDSNPKGGWVDAQAVTEPLPTVADKAAEAPDITFGGWVMSSFDLLKGLEVSDGHGTVPAELFDQLFAPRGEGAGPAPEPTAER